LSAWNKEQEKQKESDERVKYQLIFKITFNVPYNKKLVNTATLHYIQVFVY